MKGPEVEASLASCWIVLGQDLQVSHVWGRGLGCCQWVWAALPLTPLNVLSSGGVWASSRGWEWAVRPESKSWAHTESLLWPERAQAPEVKSSHPTLEGVRSWWGWWGKAAVICGTDNTQSTVPTRRSSPGGSEVWGIRLTTPSPPALSPPHSSSSWSLPGGSLKSLHGAKGVKSDSCKGCRKGQGGKDRLGAVRGKVTRRWHLHQSAWDSPHSSPQCPAWRETLGSERTQRGGHSERIARHPRGQSQRHWGYDSQRRVCLPEREGPGGSWLFSYVTLRTVTRRHLISQGYSHLPCW